MSWRPWSSRRAGGLRALGKLSSLYWLDLLEWLCRALEGGHTLTLFLPRNYKLRGKEKKRFELCVFLSGTLLLFRGAFMYVVHARRVEGSNAKFHNKVPSSPGMDNHTGNLLVTASHLCTNFLKSRYVK